MKRTANLVFGVLLTVFICGLIAAMILAGASHPWITLGGIVAILLFVWANERRNMP